MSDEELVEAFIPWTLRIAEAMRVDFGDYAAAALEEGADDASFLMALYAACRAQALVLEHGVFGQPSPENEQRARALAEGIIAATAAKLLDEVKRSGAQPMAARLRDGRRPRPARRQDATR